VKVRLLVYPFVLVDYDLDVRQTRQLRERKLRWRKSVVLIAPVQERGVELLEHLGLHLS